jgi:N-acetylmuramoyl-L-alanine amidase
LPAKKVSNKTISFPIFGKEHAATEIKSNRLSGTIYYLVSGHGGPDPGTISSYANESISEDEYAYDVTLRLAKELISHGAIVYVIIRDNDDGIRDKRILKMDTDEVVYPKKQIPLNQIKRLKQRTETINNLYLQHTGKYRRLIVTHVDSRSSGQNIDVFFYHHKKSKGGKKLAESIHKTFKEKYKKYQPNREYTSNGIYRDW